MIRLAVNEDGERIGELEREGGFVIEDVDWSQVYPYWLVYEKDGQVMGCIQVAPARPFGRLDMLAVDQSLDGHARGRAVLSLLIAGANTIKRDGAQYAFSIIGFRHKSYKRALKKRGLVILDQGHVMAMNLDGLETAQ